VTLAEAGSVVAQMAGQAVEADAVGPVEAVRQVGVERVVAGNGYHSQQVLEELAAVGVRSVIAEPERKRQRWAGHRAAQTAVYANRRRLKTPTGKALMRRRGALLGRTFAHLYETGGLRRVHLRGKDNIAKGLLIHAAAFNLSLILRRLLAAPPGRRRTVWPRFVFAFCASCTPQIMALEGLHLAGSLPGRPTRRGAAIDRRTVKT